MKNKKILTIIITLFISSSISLISSADLVIEHGTTQDVFVDDWHSLFPSAVNSSNGTWVVTYMYGDNHDDNDGVLNCVKSYDYGQTWSTPSLIRDSTLLPAGKTASGIIVRAPNGTLVTGYMQARANKGGWSLSYDNGTTWHYQGIIDEGVTTEPSGMHVVNGTIYMCTSQIYDCGGSGHYISHLYTSADNGSSWTYVCAPDSGGVIAGDNEWDFIPINDTYFIACFREAPVAGHCWFAESFNAGVNWTNFTDRSSEFSNGFVQRPQFNWLNRDEGVIILSGRWMDGGTTMKTSYWISNDSCQTWYNWSVFSVGDSSYNDAGYTGFIEQDNSGFLVFYNGTKVTPPNASCPNIYGVMVYDNTSYPSQSETIQFISINGNTNGTTIYNSTPTINWTVVVDTSQYWLQIDNNADFSSPEVNYTDINQWNYPSNCNINATRVLFTLPLGLTNYDTYYMRVRAYTR